jgi:guanylate kinase
LEQRLNGRGQDAPEVIAKRVAAIVAAMMVTTIKKTAGYNPQFFTLH